MSNIPATTFPWRIEPFLSDAYEIGGGETIVFEIQLTDTIEFSIYQNNPAQDYAINLYVSDLPLGGNEYGTWAYRIHQPLRTVPTYYRLHSSLLNFDPLEPEPRNISLRPDKWYINIQNRENRISNFQLKIS